jgi:hypothetical protein
MAQPESSYGEEVPLDQRLAELAESFARLESDNRSEPVFAAFGAAALQAINGETDVSEDFTLVVTDFLAERSGLRAISAEYAREVLIRGFQRRVMFPRWHDYPVGHDTAEAWTDLFRSVLRDPQQHQLLEEDLGWREIQTNEVRRGVGILLVAKAFPELLQPELVIVELGCADNLILSNLAKGATYDLKVLGTQAEKKWCAAAAASPLIIQKAFGIDYMPPDWEWIQACRRPSELFTEAQNALEDLRNNRPGNVSFVRADFSSALDMSNFRHSPETRDLFIDISAIITSLYMQTPAEQENALAEQRKLGAKIDVALVFADVDPSDPTRLIVASEIHSGAQYNLLVRLGHDEAGNWVKLGTFNSGRASTFRPSRALKKIIQQQSKSQAS